jgi:O-antigen/teichoic acid export membrane protein
MKFVFTPYLILFRNIFNVGIVQASSVLFQLISISVIIRQYGLFTFGEIALSTNIAYLFINIINFGTNQIVVKNIAVFKYDQLKLSEFYSQTLHLRSSVFLMSVFVIYFISKFTIANTLIWISILPFLLAEIFNPLFFLLGVEKLHWLSWNILIARLISLLLIIFVFIDHEPVIYLNLFVGLPLLLLYIFLFFFILFKYHIKITFVSIKYIRTNFFNNFYVTFNGSIGMLQQSIFLFFVAFTFNTTILGAYGLIDKILNAFRQLISVFSAAIYPRAAIMYNVSKSNWLIFRKNTQIIYLLFSITTGFILFFYPTQFLRLFSKELNIYLVEFTRLLPFAFIFLSLNANNILDLLLAEKFKSMFYISIIILISTILISIILTKKYFQLSIGWYPFLIEVTCYLIYLITIRKLKLHAA